MTQSWIFIASMFFFLFAVVGIKRAESPWDWGFAFALSFMCLSGLFVAGLE